MEGDESGGRSGRWRGDDEGRSLLPSFFGPNSFQGHWIWVDDL